MWVAVTSRAGSLRTSDLLPHPDNCSHQHVDWTSNERQLFLILFILQYSTLEPLGTIGLRSTLLKLLPSGSCDGAGVVRFSACSVEGEDMGDMSVSAGGSGGQVVLALTTSSAGVTIHPWHHLQPTAPQSTLAANYYQPLPFLSSPLPVKQNPRPSLIGVRAKSSARPKFCRASALLVGGTSVST